MGIRSNRLVWLSAASLLALAGCEGGLSNVKLPGLPTAAELQSAERAAENHRREFRESKAEKSIRWLLANRVKQGMTFSDVNLQLGESGELVDNDAHLKRGVVGLRLTDETRRWGPDENGRQYFLFFRNERLVMHKPDDYR